jgi:hypothetical protein
MWNGPLAYGNAVVTKSLRVIEAERGEPRGNVEATEATEENVAWR